MNNIILKTQNVVKNFTTGNVTVSVLKNINLNINSGEIVVIYGPSGAGKTTLLHILSSLDQCTEGDAFYKEKNFKDLREEELADLRNNAFGFVFQFHYLLQEFTVIENVLMPAIISGKYFKSKDNYFTNAIELISFMGIGTKENNYPSQISGGESQRVAIARALLNTPEVVFMDEPTGNLDRKTGSEIIDLILEINKIKKIGFIIVSHDEAILRIGHKKINLVDGVIK